MPNPQDRVRVKDASTGHEYTVSRRRFDSAPEGAFEELEKAATFADGTDVPPKYNTTVKKAAAKKSAASTAKES